jgi:hypothetical protein
MTDRPYIVNSDAWGTAPVELYQPTLEKQKDRLVLSDSLSLLEAVRDLTDSSKFMLPIAAEKLKISRNIQDYVLTPVISMPSDLPNRNGQAFPYSELTGWCVDGGAPMYKTWVGKPAYVEHANTDPLQAKGLIVDCIMRPILGTDGDIWKVIKLVAWDRTKDPALVNDILANKRNCYSMGAHAEDFSCSVCSKLLSKGGCEHVQHGKPTFKIFSNKLAYYNVANPIGFELSSVLSPAFSSAANMPHFAWLT